MMNKEGKVKVRNWIGPAIAFAVLIIGTIVIGEYTDTSFSDISQNYKAGLKSFGEILTVGGKAVPLSFLDYIFGKIPGYLVNQVANPLSAGIIVISIWVAFFLIFGDIMTTFGPFTKGINWTVAFLLALIGANLNMISFIAVYFLTVLAIFGSLSIILSLGMIFVLFVLFHFGTSGLRTWVVKRRAEDAALKAEVGGTEAGAGLKIMKKIAQAAREE